MKNMTMTPVQVSMLAFIAFTALQIATFLRVPSLWNSFAEFDVAPDFPAFRLIGAKEVGLMALYSFSVLTNDTLFIACTILGRSFVVPYFAFLVSLGAPPIFFIGGLLDILGLLWTSSAFFSLDQSARKRPTRVGMASHVSLMEPFVRLAVLVFAMLESVDGLHQIVSPESHASEHAGSGHYMALAHSSPGPLFCELPQPWVS